jgi:DNA primase
MRGDVDTIKERLDIAEIVGEHVKLDKAGTSFKGRCPFHNEKTPSFFVSPARQSYYCFGCGAKGDIFTFVEEIEGLSFREALKSLAEKAGVELENRPEAAKARSEKETLLQALEAAAQFFETQLKNNEAARRYVSSRGISDESVKRWRLGYAPAEWRALYSHLLSVGFKKETLLKAGLAKPVAEGAGKEPYDVFRDRIIFPLSDSSGDIIAFSGRAIQKETEPKYLNSPDTVLFTKSQVLYGLDKAKEKIRRKDYAVLVEGQIDLVLSHQVGVDNTVASSGTAFTSDHLERLKRLSKRILLAFDGDKAGQAAAEKASALALSLGLEVKMAKLPEGQDPAEIAKADPQAWKEVLRQSLPAIEHFLNVVLMEEKESRKRGLAIGKRILPLISLLNSSIEKSHFISLIAQKTGIKEDILWEDLKKVPTPGKFLAKPIAGKDATAASSDKKRSHKEVVEERLTEVRTWLKELPTSSSEEKEFKKEEDELLAFLAKESLKDELYSLSIALKEAETSKEESTATLIAGKIQEVHKRILSLEEGRKVL